MTEHDDIIQPEVDVTADAVPETVAPETAGQQPGVGEGAAPQTAPAPETRRRFPWKWVALGVVLVAVVVLVLPVFSTLQPRYYERYPSMRGRMANWRSSTHARVSCAGCHMDPGASGFATFAVRSIPAFYSQLVFGPSEQNLLKVPDRQACQKCHTSYRQVSANGDLLIPHKAHVEVLEVNCPTCHKNLVHSANSLGFNKPEMEMCLETCHDGEQASNKCTDCHTRKQVPPSHKAKDWLAIHGTKVDTADCGSCHAWSPDYCKECHAKRPASHAGNWKTLHADRAKAQGEKGCLVCHEQKFCKDCHD